MKKSGTVIRRDQSDSPAARHLPLVDILVDAQAELQALVVASGLKVLEAMLEEDRVAVCGPRYTHQPVGGELLLSPQSVEIIKFGDPGSGR